MQCKATLIYQLSPFLFFEEECEVTSEGLLTTSRCYFPYFVVKETDLQVLQTCQITTRSHSEETWSWGQNLHWSGSKACVFFYCNTMPTFMRSRLINTKLEEHRKSERASFQKLPRITMTVPVTWLPSEEEHRKRAAAQAAHYLL